MSEERGPRVDVPEGVTQATNLAGKYLLPIIVTRNSAVSTRDDGGTCGTRLVVGCTYLGVCVPNPQLTAVVPAALPTDSGSTVEATLRTMRATLDRLEAGPSNANTSHQPRGKYAAIMS